MAILTHLIESSVQIHPLKLNSWDRRVIDLESLPFEFGDTVADKGEGSGDGDRKDLPSLGVFDANKIGVIKPTMKARAQRS